MPQLRIWRTRRPDAISNMIYSRDLWKRSISAACDGREGLFRLRVAHAMIEKTLIRTESHTARPLGESCHVEVLP
ncbi:hypothetical protein KUCAC02_022296, partial [Chaenocephalus aceratus]